jgi:hypothetical protein
MKIYPTLESAFDLTEAFANSLGKGVDFWVLLLENTNDIV